MKRKITFGTPEWVEAKDRKKNQPIGFWQVRVIVEHLPNFFERLFKVQSLEEVHCYIHLCDNSQEYIYDQYWFSAEGERLTSYDYDHHLYKRAERLTKHVKDFMAKDHILKLQEDIINRSRA